MQRVPIVITFLLLSVVLSSKRIFNGNQTSLFILEPVPPATSENNESTRVYFIEATPLLHTGVDGECTRLFYLQLQPWFSLPAALPEPANDRISLTYPVVACISLSFTLSLSLSPLSFSLSRSFLFRRATSALPASSLWSVVQVNSRETCIKLLGHFKRAFLARHCWLGEWNFCTFGRGALPIHSSTSFFISLMQLHATFHSNFQMDFAQCLITRGIGKLDKLSTVKDAKANVLWNVKFERESYIGIFNHGKYTWLRVMNFSDNLIFFRVCFIRTNLYRKV